MAIFVRCRSGKGDVGMPGCYWYGVYVVGRVDDGRGAC